MPVLLQLFVQQWIHRRYGGIPQDVAVADLVSRQAMTRFVGSPIYASPLARTNVAVQRRRQASAGTDGYA